eukprot:1862650-Rhodomonas_salina.2
MVFTGVPKDFRAVPEIVHRSCEIEVVPVAAAVNGAHGHRVSVPDEAGQIASSAKSNTRNRVRGTICTEKVVCCV